MNLEKAIKQRDAFLSERPHLQALQDELDGMFADLSTKKRILILSLMIESNFGKIAQLFNKPNQSINMPTTKNISHIAA